MIGLFAVCAGLLVWGVIVALGLFSPLLLPSPFQVVSALIQLLKSGAITSDLAATLSRAAISISVGLLAGVPAGLVIGYFNRLYRSLEFIIDFLRSVPATALMPLFLLFFGLGETAKIALAAFVVALTVLVSAIYGVRHANKQRVMAAKTLRLKNFAIFKKVIFPEAIPHISAGVRLSISLALIIVIVAEMFVGTDSGLGRRIVDSQLIYETADMYAAIIIAGIAGYLINKLYLLAERQIHWAGR